MTRTFAVAVSLRSRRRRWSHRTHERVIRNHGAVNREDAVDAQTPLFDVLEQVGGEGLVVPSRAEGIRLHEQSLPGGRSG